jgi:hypothetical protein
MVSQVRLASTSEVKCTRYLAVAKYPTKVCDLLRNNLLCAKTFAKVQLSVTQQPAPLGVNQQDRPSAVINSIRRKQMSTNARFAVRSLSPAYWFVFDAQKAAREKGRGQVGQPFGSEAEAVDALARRLSANA